MMSLKKHTPSYLKPYQDAVDTHGGTFEATLWCSKLGQNLRFNCFTDAIDFTGTSVLDVGCGIGDFATFLIDSTIAFRSYKGIDAMEAMVDSAKKKQLKHCEFIVGDVLANESLLQDTDWSIFSGTLNAMTQENAMELIKKSFHSSAIGVAFNFLSNQCWRELESEDLSPASRFNTLDFLHFAFSLTPLVSFTQMYLRGHDATIILRKQEVPQ